MFDEPLKWLRRNWWGLIIAYLLLLISTYIAIWQFAEPFGIPDSLNQLPNFAKTRIFFHLSLTLLLSAYITLILDFIIRFGEYASQQSAQDEKLLLEKIGFGLKDTPINSCWKVSAGDDLTQLTLRVFNDGFFGKALEIKSKDRYAADYDVRPQASLGALAEFIVRPDDQRAMVYVHLIVLSKDGSLSKPVWLSVSVGVEKPSPHEENEWKFPVKPDHVEGDWLRFQIDLSDAVAQTFGKNGWRYGQLKGFRLRGNLSLVQFSVFARK